MTLLLSSAILFYLTLTLSALRCYTTICSEPDEHGFCIQTCSHPSEVCYGSFLITPNHTVTPGTFRCHIVLDEDCPTTSCQISSTMPSFGSCCCRGDLCNIIPGLFGDNTPAPPIIDFIPPDTPPPVAENQLVCEFNNCTSSYNTDCYHGYEVCTDHHSADLSSSNHFSICVVHARRTSSGLYELQFKGCVITTDPMIHQLGAGQSKCTLDTRNSSQSDIISCYCDQLYCNSGANLNFTDASRYVGPTGDILCDNQCSHSCVVSGGVPRCLCPVGYALDMDFMTCVDINECLNTHSHQCSHICINLEGSYRCDCPPDQGLRLALNKTDCEPIPGLVCASYTSANKSGIKYCDRTQNYDAELESCIAAATYTAGEFIIHVQSCFTSALHEPCNWDNCVLRVPRGSRRSDIYSCCCRTNFCNTRIVYPQLPDVNTAVPELSELPMQVSPARSTGTTEVSRSIADMSAPGSSADLGEGTQPIFIASTAFIPIVIVIVVVIICLLVCRRQSSCKKHTRTESGIQLSAIRTIIASGRFSTVYRQTIATDVRAVKVFLLKNRSSYERELAIYSQPNIKHENILQFIGKKELQDELQIVLEYHQAGSLYEQLKKKELTMKEFCEIALSSARGLAHLHTEAISHRNINSKNILIKNDLMTACIGDFNLAIKWSMDRITQAQDQVGTPRYMSPELLEGAVTFECEAYLRIDVYALAIVLWEISTRTNTLTGPVMEYRPPFDGLVPPYPSIDDMKKVVVTQGTRPEIPKPFLNYPDIVSTIQESWDVDAEARLTAHCLYERLVTFTNQLESSKDSGFFPSEVDTAEVDVRPTAHEPPIEGQVPSSLQLATPV